MNPNTPVLIGVGQAQIDWSPSDAAKAPSPLGMASLAAREALADCGAADDAALRRAIDAVAVVRTMADSVPFDNYPFGRCENMPRGLADRVGVNPSEAVYATVGGDTPQALIGEYAEKIFVGKVTAALLAGGEAIAAMKTAQRAGETLDWNLEATGDFDDRMPPNLLADDYELKNGLGFPANVYPLFENAYRARMKRSTTEHRRAMSELFANFSKVAAGNPYAQFPTERTVEFLETESKDNYAIADPYYKWHVAQDAVNQGAAVVMTSVAKARELGVPEERFVYLHGYAKGADVTVSRRKDLSKSPAIEKVLELALASSDRSANDIAHLDLYSCFPIAVFLAAEALGVDWRSRQLTQTGGLPFFGGAGNNYSMHGIASLVEKLRANPGDFGLALANGGFLSKEAAGVYSTTPPAEWKPVSSEALQKELDEGALPEPLSKSGAATIDGYTVVFQRGTPIYSVVVADMDGAKVLAKTRRTDDTLPSAMTTNDCAGRTVTIAAEEKANFIDAVDGL